jgi:hypothetical protein
MLESQTLWMSEHKRPPGSTASAAAIRQVRTSAGGRELGRITIQRLRWWPWNVPRIISVSEGPDNSAVFAGRRASWLPRDWDVLDADGRLVGLIRGSFLLGADGRVLGQCAMRRERGAGKVVDPNGILIVQWWADGAGTLIRFSPALDEQPFAKMTILIAVLIAL